MARIVAYIRVSTDRQENSPGDQRREIEEWCAREGHALVHVYEDIAESAGSASRRPGLMELVYDAERGLFDWVVVHRKDRAFRNLEDQVVIQSRLRQRGIRVKSLHDPEAEGAVGNLLDNVLGAVAQFERELTGERLYFTNLNRARDGRPTWGGAGILGYDYDPKRKTLVQVPAEAEAVRKAFAYYLDYESAYAAADRLREEGVPTKTGAPWTAQRVLGVIANEVYLGKVRFGRLKTVGPGKRRRQKEYMTFEGGHAAIVDEAAWHAANQVRRRNFVHPSRPATPALLSGLLWCGRCGARATVVGQVTADVYGYACSTRKRLGPSAGCEGWSKRSRMIEPVVMEIVRNNLKRLQALVTDWPDPVSGSPQRSDLSQRRRALDLALERQREAYESGAYTLQEFRERRERVLEERTVIEAALQAEVNVPAVTRAELGKLAEFPNWEHLTPHERRQWLGGWIERIESDGQCLTVVFRDFGVAGWERTHASQLPVRYREARRKRT